MDLEVKIVAGEELFLFMFSFSIILGCYTKKFYVETYLLKDASLEYNLLFFVTSDGKYSTT